MQLTDEARNAMLENLNLYKNIAAGYVAEENKSCAITYFHRFEGAIETLYVMDLITEEEGGQMLANFWDRPMPI